MIVYKNTKVMYYKNSKIESYMERVTWYGRTIKTSLTTKQAKALINHCSLGVLSANYVVGYVKSTIRLVI